MYLKPSSASVDEDKVSTIFYTILGPMLNPFIYSIRNKDVHIALKKTLKKKSLVLSKNYQKIFFQLCVWKN